IGSEGISGNPKCRIGRYADLAINCQGEVFLHGILRRERWPDQRDQDHQTHQRGTDPQRPVEVVNSLPGIHFTLPPVSASISVRKRGSTTRAIRIVIRSINKKIKTSVVNKAAMVARFMRVTEKKLAGCNTAPINFPKPGQLNKRSMMINSATIRRAE